MGDFNSFVSFIFGTISTFLLSEPIKYLWYMLICYLVVDLLFQLIGLGSSRRKGGRA